LFSSFDYEMNGVRIRAGQMKRQVVTNKISETVVEIDLETPGSSVAQEFTVEVGTVIDEDGSYKQTLDPSTNRELFPTVGTLSFADVVRDNKNNDIKINSNILHALIRMASGLDIGIDENGILYIYDKTNNNYIKWKINSLSSAGTELFIKVHDSSIEIKNGKVEVISGSASTEKSILGETLLSKLDELITAIQAITVPTGVGPSGTPINSATFSAIKNDLSSILSQQVKNN